MRMTSLKQQWFGGKYLVERADVMTRIPMIVDSDSLSIDDIQSEIDNSKSSISSILVSRLHILYIFQAMKSSNRNRLSLLVLLCYLIGGVLIEIAHHDDTNFLLQSQPVLSSHDCGAKEVHVPLESASHCLACTQSTHRGVTQATQSIAVDANVVCVAALLQHTEQLLETDVYHSGKRGPPLA